MMGVCMCEMVHNDSIARLPTNRYHDIHKRSNQQDISKPHPVQVTNPKVPHATIPRSSHLFLCESEDKRFATKSC